MRDWTPEMQREIDNMNRTNGGEMDDGNEFCVDCGDCLTINPIDTEAVKGKVHNWMYETCTICADEKFDDPGDNYTSKELDF